MAELYITGFFIFAFMKIKTFLFIIGFILLPLLNYGQIDSLEYRNIYNWKINPDDLSLEYAKTDTSLEGFQRYNPLLKTTITATYLGNLGTPAKSNIYYDRDNYNTGFIFSDPYGIYFHHPDNQLYFNTKKRYTLLNYSNAGPKNESEQLLGVLHTQNVTPDFNVGIDYDMISSDGRYQEQQVRQNIIKLFSSYNKNKYRVHVNYYLNRNKAQENGGIDSLSYLGSDEYNNRQNIPVKLTDARNQVFSTGLYIAQEYHLGRTVKEKVIVADSLTNDKSFEDTLINEETFFDSIPNDSIKVKQAFQDTVKSQDSITSVNDRHEVRAQKDADKETEEKLDSQSDKTVKTYKYSGFSISHELFYNNDVRKFFDDNLTEPFYNELDIFIDSSKTHDEVRQKRFANSLSLHYRYKDKFSTRLTFYNEQMRYKYNIIPDTTFTDTLINPVQDTIVQSNNESLINNNRLSFFAKGILFDHIIFKGKVDYFIDGYKENSSSTNLTLAYILFNDFEIALKGKYTNQKPDFLYSEFTSNHFKWENDSLRMIEDLDIGFAIKSSKYRLNAAVRYGQITNYLYFDSTAYTNQYDGQIDILSAELSKKITLGPIHSDTRFVYQKSSADSILSLPEFNLYQSLYYEKLLRFKSTGGELLVQLGVDYRYASSFYADGYMPQTGVFHKQFDHKLGDFHRFDVFANFTLKRARFYIQYSYLNSALNENYYFNGPYYPSPEPVFKYGIAWSFYD